MTTFNQVAVADVSPACPLCGDTGLAPFALGDWVQIDAGEWACGLCGNGRAIAQDFEAAQADKVRADLLAAAVIPERFAHTTLDTYVDLARKQKSTGASKVDAARQVKHWMQKADPRWLYLCGPTGVGKTGLACAALQGVMGAHYSGRFISTFDMLADMRKRFGEVSDATADAYADALAAVDVLVIDELHPIRVTEWTQQVLFSLLWRRDNSRKVTILTSTLGLGDAELHRAVTEAGVRRIKGNALVVRIDGNPLGFGQ